jgi:hypothetical protein
MVPTEATGIILAHCGEGKMMEILVYELKEE